MGMIEERTLETRYGRLHIVRLTNAHGAFVELSSLGAGILAVGVPDRKGKIGNVALSYADPADYMADGPCLGKIPGRFANRIAKGVFALDGKEYTLPVNNGPNHLHGGPEGFQNRIWETELLSNGVRFKLRSDDGDAGYPGELSALATYRWSDENELSLVVEAHTTAPTVVNLTNHAYWNLKGADAGSVLDHEMRVKGSHWLPTDETLIPTGGKAPVAGTPMDFLEWKRIGRDINADFPALKFGKGYDNCWIVDTLAGGELEKSVVELRDEVSGRTLSVDTDQPGVQVYTGNWLAGSPKNHSGKSYGDYDGVAIEAQGFPDAPNQEGFPSQRLNPGETYRRTIVFRFGVMK